MTSHQGLWDLSASSAFETEGQSLLHLVRSRSVFARAKIPSLRSCRSWAALSSRPGLPCRLRSVISRAGRVERWRANFRVRWLVRSFRGGPQSGSHGYVSSAPPKIPYGEFSPVRLQAEAFQPGPARTTAGVKLRVHMPPTAARFDRAFVPWRPSCLMVGIVSQPASSRTGDRLGPRVLHSARFCSPRILATTTRSADLGGSPGFPSGAGYTGGLRPTTRSGLPPRSSSL